MRFRPLAFLFAASLATAATAQTPCAEGMAGPYACHDVDLMAHLPLGTFASPGSSAPSAGNDIWGWTDSDSGREFAVVGLTNGTAFVEITNPASPVFIGKLPTATSNSSWRDVKSVGDFAYIVSEAGSHGMQVFDLRRLLTVASPPVTFAADARYTGFGNAHNIVVDEDSELAIGVGSSGSCSTGLHMVDVSAPRSPTFAGCYDGDGYTHDAQCLVYDGPDADYVGRSICVASNEDSITIVDVTTPASPVQISKSFYPNPSYTHQGWFADDMRYFIVNDETDGNSSTPTRTIVMDLLDLDQPDFAFFHDGTTAATDHNLYVHEGRVFQSNYRAGLQILDAAGIGGGLLSQVAYFDTFPASDAHGFDGQWSNYPYFPSGIVVANDISNGLFVLAPREPASPPTASVSPGALDVTLAPGETGAATVTVANGPGGGPLLYGAALQNLSQPDGSLARRPLLSRPAASLGRPVHVGGRPAGVDPGALAEPPRDGAEVAGVAPFQGSGGPDAFGYAWVDSDEPGGPAVAFQDISGAAPPVAFTPASTFDAGDEGYADVALPFAFPFYGDAKTSVRVYTNGFLTFSSVVGNSYTNPSGFPGNSGPTNIDDVIAPFWEDLDLSSAGAVYTGTLADGRFVVQWDGVPRYGDSGSAMTFQAILSPNGTIEVQYGTMTGTVTSASVGIENATATDGLAVVANAPYVASNKAVLFYSPVVWASLSGATSGTLEPGTSADLSVDLDATDLPAGTYTAELAVSTNDPLAPSITVPVTLTVSGTGTASLVVDGPRGSRFLGVPSPGVTVDDLAGQNLVRGVPGYYPAANPPNLWTSYDAVGAEWVVSAGTGEVLEPGRGFRWYMYDRNVGNPDVSRSVELPFTLSTALPANTADVTVELQTGGSRFNYLANPFGEPLDLSGIYSWPGGDEIAPSAPIHVYNPVTRAWDDAPTSLAPWESFRVRAKGPRVSGEPRVLTIPASAAGAPAARHAVDDRPRLAFELRATDADGLPLADRAFTIAFTDAAGPALDPDDELKLQPPAAAYALVGSRVGTALVGFDARPFARGEVPIALDARGASQAMTLAWDASALPAGLPVALVDLVTGVEVDVRARSSYAFEAPARPALAESAVLGLGELADPSAAADRFVLRIGAALAEAGGVDAVELTTIAPNPSSSTARVAFAVPTWGRARVSVVDVRGREVAVVFDGSVEAGRHEAELESSGLAAGVYLIRLEAGGAVVTRHAAVVR
jgi:choice-of-anchor B domain-containing protein